MVDENRHLIYEKYSEVLDGILVYQDQQVELREMCLKIMLGSFALVGGLLFVKIDISSHALLIISAAFPFLSLIVVTVNLAIDLIYKERLKLAFISEALRLEKTHKWLPKFHLSLISKEKRYKYTYDRQITYYLGCAALLMLMSAISLSLDPFFSSYIYKIAIFLSYLIVYLMYQWFWARLLKRSETLLEDF